MSGKAHLSTILGTLLLAACAAPRTEVAPPPAAAPVASATTPGIPAPPRAAVTRPAVRPAVRPAPAAPQPELASLIRANVTREGNTLLVSRRPTGEAVPLFRQAIVLANVRSALSTTPATAEFRRGLLTVHFPSGTDRQIAGAINRTLEVPEVARLRATLPP